MEKQEKSDSGTGSGLSPPQLQHYRNLLMPKAIIDLGSGRCGTMSLAHLLDSQSNPQITHETCPMNFAGYVIENHNIKVGICLNGYG